MDTWTHKFTASVPAPKSLARSASDVFTVEAGLRHLRGNALPYFSVTAWCGQTEAAMHSGGCMHDEILYQWPALAPVVALHLSDSTGQPMHAEANGWYQLAGYYRTDERYHAGNASYGDTSPEACLARFADHVRLPLDVVRTLANEWRCDDDWKASRRWFGRWLESQAPRFQAEADAAIALLDSLIAKGGS